MVELLNWYLLSPALLCLGLVEIPAGRLTAFVCLPCCPSEFPIPVGDFAFPEVKFPGLAFPGTDRHGLRVTLTTALGTMALSI